MLLDTMLVLVTMVKIGSSRTSLRKRQGPKASLLAILVLILTAALLSVLLLTKTFVSDHSPTTLQHDDSALPAKKQSTGTAGTLPPQTLDKKGVATIGYAVSVTGCGSDPLTEGAAVLKHSIHQASVRANADAKYDYHMYAIVHPDALECGNQLLDLGYTILKRDTPVAVKDIKGEYLRTHIEANGCCGEKELIKLEAYTLIQHPVVVHLDLDTLVLKPLDGLFDLMIEKTADASKITVMWKDKPFPKTTNAFFTRDYNMVNPKTKYKPVQGGFLVLRPSMDTYKEFCDIVREGDFRNGKGWGGVVGPFYGSMTFQGIVPYYYDYLHPGTALELNRCIYNQMCDNPRDKRTVDDVVHGNCRTGEDECEDCRSRPLEDVVTSHFTLCQKP
jgi:hypothetical protein